MDVGKPISVQQKTSYSLLPVKVFIKHHLDFGMEICDQIREKPPLTHKDKYLEICNLIIQLILYLQNAWSCLHTILHRCTVINGISVYELFNE